MVKKMGGEANKSLKKMVCGVIVTLVLAGCAKANLVDSNSIVQDGIEYYIQTNRSVYDLGEDVEILHRITNLRSEVWRIIRTGPVEDIFISARKGQDFDEVWILTLLHPPLPGPYLLRLQPNESAEISVIWTQIDLRGTIDPGDDIQVPPGTYRVTGVVRGSEGFSPPIAVNESVSIDISIIPEPCSAVLLATGMSIFIYSNRKRRH